jgi:hypothetical protein
MANVDSLNVASASEKDPPLGGTLYPIYDTTLIYRGAYKRVIFTGSETDPKGIVKDTIDLHLDDIRDHICDYRTVIRPSGQQEFAVLSSFDGGDTADLSVVAMTDQRSDVKKLSLKLQSYTFNCGARIIGYPLAASAGPLSAKRSLALLVPGNGGYSDGEFAVVEVDVDTGVCSEPRQFPPVAKQTDLAGPANLVRRGSSTILVWVTHDQPGTARLHAVAWEHLADHVKKENINTLDLGDAGLGSLGYFSGPPAVQVTVTSMQANSADQQIAVAWNQENGSKIALVGWGADGKLTVKTTVTAAEDFCTLAAADLLHKGSEQLVVGHTGGLKLYTLEADGTLKCFGKELHCDFHGRVSIGAGLFGTCMGVQVFVNSIEPETTRCGFVPVDPNVGFQPDQRPYWAWIKDLMPGEKDRVIPGSRLSFPSDLTGQTVRLGRPKLQPVEVCTQIVAVIQAPPYESGLEKDHPPTISFSESDDQNLGFSAASDSAYSFSKDFGEHLQIGGFLSLSKNVHDSFTQSFNKAQDHSESKNLSFSATGDMHDLLLVYGMSYDVWRYPVVSSLTDTKNEILVVVPTMPQGKLHIVAGYHPAYGYRPRSEVGMLLSYVGVEKDGFTEANRLFQTIGISVSESTGGSSVSGGNVKSNSDIVGKHYSVSNSISTSAELTAQTDLFGFLPISFGLNVSEHETFANSTVSTTHFTSTEHISWHLNSGYVTDSIYSYEITPCVYVHDKLGFLVISWDVDLSPGANYNPKALVQPEKRVLDIPDICLIRVSPFSDDIYQKWYSRSIRFNDKTSGKLTIEVDVFNNSINGSGEVTCEFFEGEPIREMVGANYTGNLAPPDKVLGQEKCAALNARGRARLALTVPKPGTLPCFITVRVSCKGSPKKKIYWNIYPADQFAATSAGRAAISKARTIPLGMPA